MSIPSRRGFAAKIVFVAIASLLTVLLFANSQFNFRNVRPSFGFNRQLKAHELGCVKIIPTFLGREGMGAMVRRSQLAFFVASALNVDINFPEFGTSHGYDLQDLFSICPDAQPSCILDEEAALIPRCSRGDCDCHMRNIAPRLEPLVRNCSVIAVRNGRYRNMEFSGCLGNTVKRYLSVPNAPWKNLDYDALHFRQGDLKSKRGTKAYTDVELKLLLQQMCLSSNRDIVIVTEGKPKVPVLKTCGDRLVLAGNTTTNEAFGIFQYAKHVSLGTSAFASLLGEVVRPERMFVLGRSAETLEWVNSEKWTVISDTYSVFHFNSKKMMVEATILRSLRYRTFITEQQKGSMDFGSLQVPKRRWSNDTSWILTRRE